MMEDENKDKKPSEGDDKEGLKKYVKKHSENYDLKLSDDDLEDIVEDVWNSFRKKILFKDGEKNNNIKSSR
ncbi:MAG: hypothetical protein HN411_06195 [Waddliaceae bacterium]|jgi:hypothetical protein|nr:hypothetical protein [Waddliaceae bacterium]MBT3578569.1 hypothetical protein [Waddliaceae bacterium]MBT4444714.1 hypothetical protein [Waddliaceae bacterium]MBT6928687.1 hypothetical protein [Waddliaceae bacterium]